MRYLKYEDIVPDSLRFVKRDGVRILQQQWKTLEGEWGPNRMLRQDYEWRDVPCVDE